MVIASAHSLVETLQKLRLLDPAQLDELNRGLPDRPTDPLLLARELLQRGWLTAYQINQLFQGRAEELLLGHYVLLERLGEGGMGQVFKAREQRLGRVVALKVLRKEQIVKPEILRRFHQEIQAVARLSHPNIVHAYDAEQVGDCHVFAMEFIDGIDLSRLVKQSGPQPAAEACEYVRQAAVGLQHMHDNDMVHRDIKPANLILARHDKTIKILDMGLARLLDEDAGESQAVKLTRMGVVMGTLDYIAPEQALSSHRADIRSDLYSLGCTFYFLLTGRVPFPNDEPMAKLLAHSCDEAVPVEQLRPEVPARLAAVVGKLMAKHPDARYQTPAELVLDLRLPVAAPAAESMPPVPPDPPMAQPAEMSTPLATKPARRPRQAGRGKMWIAAAAVLSSLLIGLLVHLFREEDAPPPALPSTEKKSAAHGPETTNSLGMKFARIPAGQFFMGTSAEESRPRAEETPAHQVTITRPFYLGVYLVTVGEFRAFVEATGYRTEGEKNDDTHASHCWQKPGWTQSDRHPAACLSWNDARAFCDWLTEKEKSKRHVYRLPSEAEWEYACRAESTTAFGFGRDPKKLDDYAWYRGNAGGKAHPVGERKPNRWGLYDMHGNLLQWCGDYYDAKFYQKIVLEDPRGPPRGRQRVLRGGWWYSLPLDCRSARRFAGYPTEHRNDRGFRVLLEAPE